MLKIMTINISFRTNRPGKTPTLCQQIHHARKFIERQRNDVAAHFEKRNTFFHRHRTLFQYLYSLLISRPCHLVHMQHWDKIENAFEAQYSLK